MTNRILQSDIDMAKRLIDARHTEDEVAMALRRRGIEPSKAKEVASALIAGQKVEPEIEINYEFGEGMLEYEHQHEPAAPVAATAEARPRRRSSGSSGSSGRGSRIALILILLLLVIGAGLFLLARFGKDSQPQDTQPIPSASDQPGDAAPTNAPEERPAATTN